MGWEFRINEITSGVQVFSIDSPASASERGRQSYLSVPLHTSVAGEGWSTIAGPIVSRGQT